MGEPSVLLVDEPTSALDHEKGAEIMALLRQVTADHDLASVVVTHDTGHLDSGDTVLSCHDGQICLSARSAAPGLRPSR